MHLGSFCVHLITSLSLCVSVSVPFSLCVCLCVCVSVSVHACVCLLRVREPFTTSCALTLVCKGRSRIWGVFFVDLLSYEVSVVVSLSLSVHLDLFCASWSFSLSPFVSQSLFLCVSWFYFDSFKHGAYYCQTMLDPILG